MKSSLWTQYGCLFRFVRNGKFTKPKILNLTWKSRILGLNHPNTPALPSLSHLSPHRLSVAAELPAQYFWYYFLCIEGQLLCKNVLLISCFITAFCDTSYRHCCYHRNCTILYTKSRIPALQWSLLHRYCPISGARFPNTTAQTALHPYHNLIHLLLLASTTAPKLPLPSTPEQWTPQSCRDLSPLKSLASTTEPHLGLPPWFFSFLLCPIILVLGTATLNITCEPPQLLQTLHALPSYVFSAFNSALHPL